ncbi:vesicle transport v-SNARE 13-like [Impatiens glandulifera]|uniref:vesicle transport v-SNARE 13-like n=1 Tax=Impatiens glandulifera TaxID=253017 RepID=UPI001FB052CC|nr:vesicle transport v-SNARE 13-like [Impatiens glandulifera]XP_047313753.1 vesicle transport v-SNARE 13-like [Impatiens glandulifera]
MPQLSNTLKAMLLTKLREYKSDLNNLKSEVKRITSTNLNQAARDELLESGMADALTVSADQRTRLLMSTERVTKSSDRIRESRKTVLETEELGVSILQDLDQ